MAHTKPTETTTAQGNSAWRYVGLDDRNRELKIIAVELTDDRGGSLLLVIHVMPTQLRGGIRHD